MTARAGLAVAGLAPAGVVVPGLVSMFRHVFGPIVLVGCLRWQQRFGRARSRRGLLGAAPARAVARVFYLDAAIGKGRAEAVRARPILTGPGRGSLIEHLLQVRFQ